MKVLEKIEGNGILIREIVYESIDMMEDSQKLINKNICSSCEFYNNDSCSACGCLVNSLLFLKTSKCPKNKW
jgi:hypothetical protein